jgi:hypothetical protein
MTVSVPECPSAARRHGENAIPQFSILLANVLDSRVRAVHNANDLGMGNASKTPDGMHGGELYVTKADFSSEVDVLMCGWAVFAFPTYRQVQVTFCLLSQSSLTPYIIVAHPEDRALLGSNSSAEVVGSRSGRVL